ncbi:MAG: hypothetical protein U1E20_06145 [Methylocystis sp.]|uniref:hypothetical protein n=1 Tax=Methylocystis sp. TaxID=1911079 RepID=UPI0039367757
MPDFDSLVENIYEAAAEAERWPRIMHDVTPLARRSAPDAALVQILFDLTPTEARVAGSLAEGLTLGHPAERHNVKLSTVRS